MTTSKTVTKEAPVVAGPTEPQSVEETGSTLGFLTDLTLKTIYFRGELSAQQIADALKLPYTNVMDRVLDFLRREQLAAISGSHGYVGEIGFQYVVTSKGTERVREALQRSYYVGPAPVPLQDYAAVAARQSIAGLTVDADRLRRGLQHLVLNSTLVGRLGPAINSGRSIFLYGPSGNGKTSIAEAIGGMLEGYLHVPYAAQADDHIIKVYDPMTHGPVAEMGVAAGPSAKRPDARWVRCRRPVVVTGGELTLANLDLVYDENAGYYEAPFQMKANGGVFVVDDLGRQQVRPRDLLNRWIVPLEKRVDFLALHTGKKIEVPFDVLIVFCTNIPPKELVDEAFLRRIRYKIEISSPGQQEFREIMQRVCAERGVTFNEEAFQHLLAEHYAAGGRELTAVHPRDLIDQILDIATYREVVPEMSKDLLEEACSSYFVKL